MTSEQGRSAATRRRRKSTADGSASSLAERIAREQYERAPLRHPDTTGYALATGDYSIVTHNDGDPVGWDELPAEDRRRRVAAVLATLVDYGRLSGESADRRP